MKDIPKFNREGTWIINGREHLQSKSLVAFKSAPDLYDYKDSRVSSDFGDKVNTTKANESPGVSMEPSCERTPNNKLPTRVSRRYIENYKMQAKRKGIQIENMFGPKRSKTSLELMNMKKSATSEAAEVVIQTSRLPVLYIPQVPQSEGDGEEDGGMEEDGEQQKVDTSARLQLRLDGVLDEYIETPGWRPTQPKSSRRLGGLVTSDVLDDLSARRPLKMEACYNYYM